HAFGAPSCTQSGSRPEISFGGGSVEANVTTPFKVSKEQIWPAQDAADPEPYYVYTYTDTCTANGTGGGTCTGTPQEGKAATVEITFDLTESIFVRNTLDLEADDEATILQ